MENQKKETSVYEEEINLYDYWKVIVKRKKIIIGLFLIALLVSAIISFLMPKIYRAQVVLKLPESHSQSLITITAKELTAKELTTKELTTKELTTKELVAVIGKIDEEKIKNILPKTHNLVADIKLTALKDSVDKLQLTIDMKNAEILPSAVDEFVTYVNNISVIKQIIENEKERLTMQLEEINRVIEDSENLKKTYKKLLESGRLIPVGFNPIELEKKISDLKIEKLLIEQGIKTIKVEVLEKPHIPKKPVKPRIKLNIVLAGIVSLFIGIFLAFFIEYVEKMRKKE